MSMAGSRRKFIRNSAWSAAAIGGGWKGLKEFAGRAIYEAIEAYDHKESAETDEEFWHLVKQAYTVSPSILNLNNGGVAPQPRVVQEAVERYNRLSNEAPS